MFTITVFLGKRFGNLTSLPICWQWNTKLYICKTKQDWQKICWCLSKSSFFAPDRSLHNLITIYSRDKRSVKQFKGNLISFNLYLSRNLLINLYRNYSVIWEWAIFERLLWLVQELQQDVQNILYKQSTLIFI